MKFSFLCTAVTHTSGRVTLSPVSLPDLAVHAATRDDALLELKLLLDDKLSRTHPRHLGRFCTPGEGERLDLALELGATPDSPPLSLRLRALQRPAQGKRTEAQVLGTNLRYWLDGKGKELSAQAQALLAEHLENTSPAHKLSLRAEGTLELLTVDLDATPLTLASLKPSELHLDERPPPKDPFAESSRPRDDDDATPADDWDEPKTRRKKPSPDKPPPTPTLERLGVAWHTLAKDDDFPPTFGRDSLVARVLAHLSLADAEPLVLIGPAGVGKSATLHEVTRRLVAQTPPGKPPRRVFALDASRLIAGQGFFGDWQRQTLDAFAEAHQARAVLHLGRLVDLLDAGRSAHSDDNVAQLLLPTLAAREVAVLAEATPEEWARVNERHQSFGRVFAPLHVSEPSADETKLILERLAAHAAKDRGVTVPDDALAEVRSLVRRFRPYGSPLGNAVTFFARLVEAQAQAPLTERTVSRLAVLRRFSVESGVPEELLRDELPLDVAEVRSFLSARVKGQPDAVERGAHVVSVIKANLSDPKRPVATLLFCGPTGVGKTELSKALAERLFGSKDKLVRLDMGEYAGPDALQRLLGAHGESGFLVTAVRQKPFSVVLLDEVEKAHPAVFDALLAVLGEGRLTDGLGRLADFRSCVIILTSNLGATTQRRHAGFSSSAPGELRAHYLAEVRRFFRPELFNRLDDVVAFAPLGPAELAAIVTREVDRIAQRAGFSRRDLSVAPSAEALEALARWGHEPAYGARPLKRALERRLVVPAAAHLAAHPPAGATRLDFSVEGESLAPSSTPTPRAADGVARVGLLEACERAGTLRAEVRAWLKSPVLRRLRDGLRLFERLSRSPSFWTDDALAQEQARSAAFAKDVWDGLEAARQQAEAAEDLAFEAYALRANHSLVELTEAVEGAREAFWPLTERLYASLFPRTDAVTLTVLPSRGAQHWGRWLFEAWSDWAMGRGLKTHVAHLLPKDAEQKKREAVELKRLEAVRRTIGKDVERVLAQHGIVAAVKVYRERTGSSLKEAADVVRAWRDSQQSALLSSHAWREGDAPTGSPWAALALTVTGDALPLLLTGEAGTHRFHVDGDTFTVRVGFVASKPKVSELPTLEVLEGAAAPKEVRRIWPRRQGFEHGLLKDLRTGTEHRANAATFPLSEVLAAWVRHRVFHGEDGTWS